MESNEIKKILYKEKSEATFQLIRKGKAYYRTAIPVKYEDETLNHFTTVNFEIPIDDMGDSDFEYKIPAQLLIRWMIVNK